MPVISMFYGIIIQLLFYDKKEHKRPHIHAKYGSLLLLLILKRLIF